MSTPKKKKQRAKFIGAVVAGKLSEFARRQVAAFIASLPDGEVVVDIAEKSQRRTSSQNDGFHAMIDRWAREEGHDIDDLKRDLLGIVFGWEDSPLSETRTPKRPHTSELTVEEFSELVERTAIIAAGQGVQLVLPSEYSDGRWAHRKAS